VVITDPSSSFALQEQQQQVSLPHAPSDQQLQQDDQQKVLMH
jgi:hypothetical protein